jgi:DNA-3-methyladenine glycosylase
MVARDLLGRLLVRRMDDVLLVGRIVETEAYQEDDPASHSYRGPTQRTEVMFGPPGRLYVYFTYGMHFCMNAVTGSVAEGSAVLLRAGEPLEGMETMAALRDRASSRDLCSGPARWCQAFAVDLALDGVDLVDKTVVWIERGSSPIGVVSGPRIGVSRGAERHWRFRPTPSKPST